MWHSRRIRVLGAAHGARERGGALERGACGAVAAGAGSVGTRKGHARMRGTRSRPMQPMRWRRSLSCVASASQCSTRSSRRGLRRALPRVWTPHRSPSPSRSLCGPTRSCFVARHEAAASGGRRQGDGGQPWPSDGQRRQGGCRGARGAVLMRDGWILGGVTRRGQDGLSIAWRILGTPPSPPSLFGAWAPYTDRSRTPT